MPGPQLDDEGSTPRPVTERERADAFLGLVLASNDLVRILDRSARILGVPIEPSGASEIARRSRGTPRIANRLLRRVRDFAQVEGTGIIDRAIASFALGRLHVDERGLDNLDRAYLMMINGCFNLSQISS